MTWEVRFGSLDMANSYREDFREYVDEDEDNESFKTVWFEDDIPNAQRERIERAAEASREERDQAGVNPATVSLSRQEERMIRRNTDYPSDPDPITVRAIKAAAINNNISDWVNKAQFSLTVSENQDRFAELAQGGGAFMDDEMEERAGSGTEGGDPNLLEEERVDQLDQSRAAEELLDDAERAAFELLKGICQGYDDAGIDGAEILRDAADGEGPIQNVDIPEEDPTGQPYRQGGTTLSATDVLQTVEDIVDDFGERIVDDAIEQCKDELSGPDVNEEIAPGAESRREVEQEVLERLENALGTDRREFVTLDEAIENIENAVANVREDERSKIRNRMARTFGVPIESVEDGIDAIKERVEEAGGLEIKEGTVSLRNVGDVPEIRYRGEEPDQDVRREIESRVLDEIDVSQLEELETLTLGTYRAQDGALTDLDLTTGKNRLASRTGDVANREELPSVVLNRTRVGLQNLENRLSDESLREFVDMVETGTVDDDLVDELREALNDADQDVAGRLVQDRDVYEDLFFATGAEFPPPPEGFGIGEADALDQMDDSPDTSTSSSSGGGGGGTTPSRPSPGGAGGGGGAQPDQPTTDDFFGSGGDRPREETREDPEARDRIASLYPNTRYSVYDRPDPSVRGTNTPLFQRFPTTQTRQAYSRHEEARRDAQQFLNPLEYWELMGEQMDASLLTKEEWLAAQQFRFID